MSEHHRTSAWVKTTRAMRPHIAANLPVPCVDCGTLVLPGQSWQVGHIVDVGRATAMGWSRAEIDHDSNLGPSHSNGSGPNGRSCNQSAGGALGAAAANAKRSARRRLDDRMPDW